MNIVDVTNALCNVLFCPADNVTVANKIIDGMDNLHSIILCLEDSILDENLEEAEDLLENTLHDVFNSESTELPCIFIRIRDYKHLVNIAKRYSAYSSIITGFVLPKFDSSNAEFYEAAITVLDTIGDFAYLPILETRAVLDLRTRRSELSFISKSIDRIRNTCGIMIGGNDLSNHVGIRRNLGVPIYNCSAIANCIGDIVSVFSSKYAIIGPIYEYYNTEGWEDGLKQEMCLDLINGCDGKACIHPDQLPIVSHCLKVCKKDYEDALRILNWDIESGVVGNDGRMMEYATNYRWAMKIKRRGNLYGIEG